MGHCFLVVHMVKCYLTESERAKMAMQVAMGLPVERCTALGTHQSVPLCILPAGHASPCVTGKALGVGCDNDTSTCPLRGRRLANHAWEHCEPWCTF